ncbi:type II toxin-antitoxin system VapB family antitoxin [Streptomyces triticagri]|uniref:Type II toxin-antitoxin system VapB family antitoxin n=1 Tax=Streptomyces triticagri TaxID=2293568 RepID=A0A372LX34_9ACTN|nr:type II toxin-antitoxin system VapB family antitoxin [Streptomyces triticagri]RFU82960.1 type II toxin-antitoxin system VapB family antitoxin [Streptomyces triticagri]
MGRFVVDIEEELIDEAAAIFDTKTKAATLRAALDDAVKRRRRWEFAEKIKSGEIDLLHDRDQDGEAAGSQDVA